MFGFFATELISVFWLTSKYSHGKKQIASHGMAIGLVGREGDGRTTCRGFDSHPTFFFNKQNTAVDRNITTLYSVLKRKISIVLFSMLQEQDHSTRVYCEKNPTGRERNYERSDIGSSDHSSSSFHMQDGLEYEVSRTHS